MRKIDCEGRVLIQRCLCYRISLVPASPGKVCRVNCCAGDKGQNANLTGLCAAKQSPGKRSCLEAGKNRTGNF